MNRGIEFEYSIYNYITKSMIDISESNYLQGKTERSHYLKGILKPPTNFADKREI